MREKILNFIEKNSRVDLKELSVLLGMNEVDVANELAAMEAGSSIRILQMLIKLNSTKQNFGALVSIH